MDLFSSLSDADIQRFIKNIDSKKFCYLILGLSESDKNRVYSQLSDKAKELVNADVKKLEQATAGVVIG